MEKENRIRKVGTSKNSQNHKPFLILIKYIFHILGFIYVVNTSLQFAGIDEPWIGCFFHVALLPWVIFISLSIKFRFCYVHRLPLYYIAINEVITNVDYYIGIPIKLSNLLVIHLLFIACLIFGYSYYYVKFKLKK